MLNLTVQFKFPIFIQNLQNYKIQIQTVKNSGHPRLLNGQGAWT